MEFFLGAHHAHWLEQVDVPLFVSRRTLAKRKSLPRAKSRWALDSAWAAPQDWMCEPDIIRGNPKKKFVGTHLSVEEHQRRTIANYLELRALAPDLPFIPVLQGWSFGDYMRHVDDYAAAGIDLIAEPRVGVGTVCRRQNTVLAGAILRTLHAEGLRLHGFGFKVQGLRMAADVLASADSLAWSYGAWRRKLCLPGHETRHKNCANCLEYALEWRADLLETLARDARSRARQRTLFPSELRPE